MNSQRSWGDNHGVIEAGNPDANNPKIVTDIQWVWIRQNGSIYYCL